MMETAVVVRLLKSLLVHFVSLVKLRYRVKLNGLGALADAVEQASEPPKLATGTCGAKLFVPKITVCPYEIWIGTRFCCCCVTLLAHSVDPPVITCAVTFVVTPAADVHSKAVG